MVFCQPTLTQELACSLNKTNPQLLPLYVYTVRGDLSPYVEEAVSRFAELRYWETDFRLPNYVGDGRYVCLVSSLNVTHPRRCHSSDGVVYALAHLGWLCHYILAHVV